MHAHIAVLTATSGDWVASEWDPDCCWEMFNNGLFSGSSFEPGGRLWPLWYQVERIASSIPGWVLPAILRVRFCVAVKGSTAWYPWKLIWVPTVLLGAACMRKLHAISGIAISFGYHVLPLLTHLRHFPCILTSEGRAHMKHSRLQHWVVSQ